MFLELQQGTITTISFIHVAILLLFLAALSVYRTSKTYHKSKFTKILWHAVLIIGLTVTIIGAHKMYTNIDEYNNTTIQSLEENYSITELSLINDSNMPLCNESYRGSIQSVSWRKSDNAQELGLLVGVKTEENTCRFTVKPVE